MKESIPGIPEIPQNFSTLGENISLEPRPDRRYPFNHYVDEYDDSHFLLSDDPSKQFIISQLASLVMPVANVVRKEMPHGETMYFSPDVKRHPDYVEENKREEYISKVNQTILSLIFNDEDHDPCQNHEGSIFYDFGAGDVESNYDEWVNLYIRNIFKVKYPEKVEELRSKVTTFRSSIEGKDGLKFIQNLVTKANYKESSPDSLQTIFLKRCERLLSALDD